MVCGIVQLTTFVILKSKQDMRKESFRQEKHDCASESLRGGEPNLIFASFHDFFSYFRLEISRSVLERIVHSTSCFSADTGWQPHLTNSGQTAAKSAANDGQNEGPFTK